MPNSGTPAQIDAYVDALKAHDWSCDFSSDMRVVRRGAEERKKLRAMQFELDDDFSIWNTHAPENYRVHVVSAPTPNPEGGDQ